MKAYAGQISTVFFVLDDTGLFSHVSSSPEHEFGYTLQEQKTGALKGTVVLAADHHPVNCKLMEGLLKKVGVSVHSVASGEDVMRGAIMENELGR